MAQDEARISFEVSKKRRALVLSIDEGDELIEATDQLFTQQRGTGLTPLSNRAKVVEIPGFDLNGYIIYPIPRQKRIIGNSHKYDFQYRPNPYLGGDHD